MIKISQHLKAPSIDSINVIAFDKEIGKHKTKCVYLEKFMEEELQLGITKATLTIDLWVHTEESDVRLVTGDTDAIEQEVYNFYKTHQGIFELILDPSIEIVLGRAFKIKENLVLDKISSNYLVRYGSLDDFKPFESLVDAFQEIKRILMKDYPDDDLTNKIQ